MRHTSHRQWPAYVNNRTTVSTDGRGSWLTVFIQYVSILLMIPVSKKDWAGRLFYKLWYPHLKVAGKA